MHAHTSNSHPASATSAADSRGLPGDATVREDLPGSPLPMPPADTPEAAAFAKLRASDLADGVMALDEPWRGRFLTLIAAYAQAYDVHVPTREELRLWLRDERLHRQIWLMLRTWTHQAGSLSG